MNGLWTLSTQASAGFSVWSQYGKVSETRRITGSSRRTTENWIDFRGGLVWELVQDQFLPSMYVYIIRMVPGTPPTSSSGGGSALSFTEGT